MSRNQRLQGGKTGTDDSNIQLDARQDSNPDIVPRRVRYHGGTVHGMASETRNYADTMGSIELAKQVHGNGMKHKGLINGEDHTKIPMQKQRKHQFSVSSVDLMSLSPVGVVERSQRRLQC
jgi:hypothetical protein